MRSSTGIRDKSKLVTFQAPSPHFTHFIVYSLTIPNEVPGTKIVTIPFPSILTFWAFIDFVRDWTLLYIEHDKDLSWLVLNVSQYYGSSQQSYFKLPATLMLHRSDTKNRSQRYLIFPMDSIHIQSSRSKRDRLRS